MRRGGALWLFIFLILFSSFVLARPDSVDLILTKTLYGSNTSFMGSLTIHERDPLDLTTDVNFLILDQNDVIVSDTTVPLDEFLDHYTGAYVLTPKLYETSGVKVSSLLLYKQENGIKYIGKELPDTYINLDKASITFSGDAYGLQVDVGDDDVIEWVAKGSRTSWSAFLVKDTFDDDWLGEKADPGTKKCENIELDYEGDYDELDVLVSVRAQKQNTLEGALTVTIGTSSCTLLPKVTATNDKWDTVSCSVLLANPKPKQEYKVCVQADKTGVFWVPTLDDTYFYNLQTGVYDKHFSGTHTLEDSDFVSSLEDYLRVCDFSEGTCIVPLKMNVSNGVNLMIDSFTVENSKGSVIAIFYSLTTEDEKLNVTNEKVTLELSKLDLLMTPKNLGNYSLSFIIDGRTSQEVTFEVVSAPSAKISLDSSYGAVNRILTFDGSGSKQAGNRSIVTYFWTFGDTTNSSGALVSHAYKQKGNYTVSLTITDSLGVTSNVSTTVSIGSLAELLDDWILDAQTSIDVSLIKYANTSTEEGRMYRLLGIGTDAIVARSNISGLEQNYLTVSRNTLLSEDAKELEYAKLATQLDELKVGVIKTITIGNRLEIHNPLLSGIGDIPTSSLSKNYPDVVAYHTAIYNYNLQQVKIEANVTEIELSGLDGKKEVKRLVEKHVTAPGASLIVENVYGISKVDVITVGALYDSLGGSIEWASGSGTYIYLLSEGDLEAIGTTVAFTSSVDLGKDTTRTECGDGICTVDYETKTSCPSDCEKDVPWSIFIALFVLVILGVYYLNFYHGKGNFRDLTNYISVKLFRKRLFTNQEDLERLKEYVSVMVQKGYREYEIRPILLGRGWTNEQVDYVLKGRFK